MRRRIHRLRLKLALAGGVDIVLTHAPVRGFGDEDNMTHRGFEAFLPLLDQYQPRYLVHGHIHQRYGANRLYQNKLELYRALLDRDAERAQAFTSDMLDGVVNGTFSLYSHPDQA